MKLPLLRLCVLPIITLSGCYVVPNPTLQEEYAEMLGVGPEDIVMLDEEVIVRKTKGIIVSIEPSGVPRKNPTQKVVFRSDKTGDERTFEILALSEEERKPLIGRKVYLSNVFDASKTVVKGAVAIPTFETLFELRR